MADGLTWQTWLLVFVDDYFFRDGDLVASNSLHEREKELVALFFWGLEQLGIVYELVVMENCFSGVFSLYGGGACSLFSATEIGFLA